MAPRTRNAVRKEVHRAIEKSKLRSLRIVPRDEEKQIHKPIEKSKAKGVQIRTVDEYCELDYPEKNENNNNQVKQAVANLEEKSAEKCVTAKPTGTDHSNICIAKPTPLHDGIDWIIAKEKPEFPCDLLYEIPDSSDPNSGVKWDPNAKIRKYYLNRRGNWSENRITVYTCTSTNFKIMLKKGLTYSKMETLPWLNVNENDNNSKSEPKDY